MSMGRPRGRRAGTRTQHSLTPERMGSSTPGKEVGEPTGICLARGFHLGDHGPCWRSCLSCETAKGMCLSCLQTLPLPSGLGHSSTPSVPDRGNPATLFLPALLRTAWVPPGLLGTRLHLRWGAGQGGPWAGPQDHCLPPPPHGLATLALGNLMAFLVKSFGERERDGKTCRDPSYCFGYRNAAGHGQAVGGSRQRRQQEPGPQLC